MRSTLVLLLTLGIHAMGATAISAERPNIILFLVDDMGWMDSTPYGSQYYETPNMQRLAKQSVRFTDAYALPLCSPTRASILSGQYSARHRVTSASGHQPAVPADASPYPASAPPSKRFLYAQSKNYLDPDLITLAEALREAGYRTCHVGKWHLGLSQEHWPDKHGFDAAFHAQPSPGPPSYFSPYGVHKDGKPSGRNHVGTITDGPDGEYITDRLTDEAIKFVEANKDQPFFLNFWHYGVHGPWGHKEEYTAEFAKKTDPRGKQRNPIMASMLKSVDESLGRLLDRLDELGLTENTLFIFYSDNGGNVHSRTYDDPKIANVKEGHPQFQAIQDWRKWAGGEPPTNNAPLREGKGRIYEGGQRVPLMVRWPGHTKAGSTSDAIVGPIDLYPTILAAADVEKAKSQIIDGESLLPVLEQVGSLKRRAYFTWFPHLIPAVSVRQGDWKLIRRFEPHPSYPEVRELYNLKEDIGENQNLAKQMPDKVKQLDALIDQFVKETGALYPKPNPAYRAQADATEGLVPRSCKLVKADGAIRIVGDGRFPFLGTARVKLNGPLKLTLIARSEAGGKGRVQWKTSDQENFPETDQSVTYELTAGKAWQKITLDLPINGQPQIVRLYLPAQTTPVEIQSIRFGDMKGRETGWDFSEVLIGRPLGLEKKGGFVPLFDGKTFTGWEQNGNWAIEGGAFYRKANGGPLTYTAQTIPEDFELRFEWKVSKGCNSGVYYRPGQVEYQVLDNMDSPYGENARQSAASLFFCMAPKNDATRPVGQWNTGRVICQGTVIEHWLNGQRVISFDYTDPKWAEYVELLAIRGGDLTGRGGRLWLQDHGHDVWFRNLRWRKIPTDETMTPDPDFKPMPVTGAALEKERARVKKMLEAKANK